MKIVWPISVLFVVILGGVPGCNYESKVTTTVTRSTCSDDSSCSAGMECGYQNYCVDLGGRDGAEACNSLAECLVQCIDDGCVAACVEGSTGAGVDRYEALSVCVRENACIDAEGFLIPECVTDRCADPYMGCFGSLPATPSGVASCGDLLECLNRCDVEDPDCGGGCVVDSSPEAVELFSAAIDCLQDAECMPGDAVCQNEICGDEIRACVDDGLGGGSLPCDAIMECVFSCTDVECGQRCISNGDEEALDLWRDFASCAGSARCNSRSSCFAVCPQQTQACAADR